MAVKTTIQQNYAISDFKSKMYPERDKTNLSLENNEHESKLIPNGRVTKLITHAGTLQTEILTLQENNCRNKII